MEHILTIFLIPIIFSLFVYKIEILGINIATYFVAISVFLVVLDTRRLVYRLSLNPNIKQLLILWAFYGAYIFILFLNSADDNFNPLKVVSYLVYALYGIVFIYLDKNEKFTKITRQCFLITFIIYFIVLLLNFTGTISGEGLLEAQHNTTAGLLLIYIALTLLLSKYTLPIKITILILSLIFVLLNGSRGAIVIYILCSILFVLRKLNPKKILVFVSTSILITSSFYLIAPSYFSVIVERIQSIYDFQIASSSNYRFSVLYNGVKHIVSNPFGTGIGSFQLIFPKISYLDLSTVSSFSADNTFIYIGFNAGIIPLSLLIIFLIMFLKITRIRQLNYSSVIIFITLSLSMAFDIIVENGNFILCIAFFATRHYQSIDIFNQCKNSIAENKLLTNQ